MSTKARAKMLKDTYQPKTHFKLYKKGHTWVIAGLTLLFSGVIATQQPQLTHADTNANDQDTANSATGIDTTASNTVTMTPAVVATIGDQTLITGGTAALPKVTMATGEIAPDWTMSDFDFSQVDTKAAGTYAVTLSKSGLAKLQAANPTQVITASHAIAGTVTVQAPSVDTSHVTTDATTESKASNQMTPRVDSEMNVAAEQVDTTSQTSAETDNTAETTPIATSQVDAVAGPVSDRTHKVNLSLSTDTIGYGSNAKKIEVNVGLTVVAGDTVSVTVPTDSPLLKWSSFGGLNASVGTSVVTKNDDGTTTITDTFNTSGQFNQLLSLEVLNNTNSKAIDQQDYGTATKKITWQVNGVDQTPLTITQTITPSVKLTPPIRTQPTVQTTPVVTTETDYQYEFALGEVAGAYDDTMSNRLQAALNTGGATITIPVPTGFLLNTDATSARNALSKGNTITQANGAGGDIVITAIADAGVGLSTQPYYLIGQFVAGTIGTVTADNQVTYEQKYADGTSTTYAGGTWSETISDATPENNATMKLTAYGNNGSASGKLALDDDPTNDPSVISYLAFDLSNSAPMTNGKFTITIPDGINATGIKVPTSGVTEFKSDQTGTYLPDTASWAYTVTLADGSVESGVVQAGGTITPKADSPIRLVELNPDHLAIGAYAARDNPIQVLGSLSAALDDGTAVSDGLQMTFNYTFSYPDVTDPTIIQEVAAHAVETVVAPVGRATYYRWQANTTLTGYGYISLSQNGGMGQTTDQIYEPILYFVLPKNTLIASKGVEAAGHPTISTYQTDDGRIGVKVDYTGTGEYVYTDGKHGSYLISLETAADAMNGSQQILYFITSPTTLLLNSKRVSDPSLTDGDTNALAMDRNQSDNTWTVNVAEGIFSATLAQGNTNATMIKKATADERGDAAMSFAYTLVNQTATTLADASTMINLPTVGDEFGSTFTYQINGPITLPLDSAIKATFLYAPDLYTPVANETTPDITGYLTADEIQAAIAAGKITDWSAIRSIYVKFEALPAEVSTGRIIVSGEPTATLTDVVQKTGYLQTYTYFSNAPFSTDTQANAASITITGTSTVTSRFHYVDASGDDQYLTIDDLTKTLNDGKDTLAKAYTALSQFSAVDQALVPAGYHLESSTVIDGTNDGAAVPGTVSEYYFDGDTIQYELVKDAPVVTTNQVTKTIRYVDEDGNALAPDYLDTSEVLTQTLDAASGLATYHPESDTLGYQALPVIKGYHVVTAPSEATADTLVTFGSSDLTVTVIYVPDVLKQVVDIIGKTVTYVMEDGTTAPKAQSVGTSIVQFTNASTKKVTYSPGDGQQVLAGIANPVVKGYTVDTSTSDVEATENQAVKFGDADLAYTVYYKKAVPTVSKDSITKTVHYVDQAGNSIHDDYTTAVTVTKSVDAATDAVTYLPEVATLGYQANPTIQGYHVVTNPSEATFSQTVQFGDSDVSYTVVYHKDTPAFDTDTVTKTVHYVDQDGNAIAKGYKAQANFTEITDPVTGEKSYGPESAVLRYQANPTIAGYHVVTNPSEATSSQTVQFGDSDVSYTVVYHKDMPAFDMDTVTKTVHYTDQDGNELADDFVTKANFTEIIDPVTGEKSYGPELETLGYQSNPTVEGYHVVTSPSEATSTQTVKFGDADVSYTVVYHKDTPVFDMDTVTKTVHYVDQDGNELADDFETKANFTEITDSVTGEKSHGPESATLGYQDNPVVEGYHVVTIPSQATSAQTVKFGDVDVSYTVVYNKNTPAFAMDTVTKTVHYVDQDGNKLADSFVTKANFTEIIDPVTGEKSYGPESATLGYQANPVVEGYHVVTSPSEVTSTQTVKFGDPDVNYTVVYNKNTPVFDMDTVTKTVHYVDQDGNKLADDFVTKANFTEITDPVTGEKAHGPESATIGYQANPVVEGYHVVISPSQATSTQTVQFGDPDVSYAVVYHKNAPAFDMDTVTKTVHYVDQDGNAIARDYETHVNFTEIIDPVTGEKSYGPESVVLGYQANPIIKGYHVVTSPPEATATQTVQFGDADVSYTVVYNKNTPDFAMDTVTKRVHYVDQDGNTIAPDYTTQANFTEITDPVTSEKSYVPETGKLNYQENPLIKGYHVVTSPAEVTSAQTVKFGDADETYTVVYNKDTPLFAMDSVTKTVHYVDQDGNTIAPDYTTQANFTEITDPVTDEKFYEPETGKLSYQENPDIKGYRVVNSSSEVTSTQTVKFGDTDETYTVVYNKDTPAFDMDTVTKTVRYVDQDGNKIADDFVTKANFTEIIDPVTSEKSYGPESAIMGYQANPAIEGYHVVASPSEATATQTVKFGDQDQSYTVVYNKNTPVFDMDTVTKTVRYVDQDGNKLSDDFVTKANFTEIIDSVTGEKSYGPQSSTLGYQANPDIEGYHVVTSPSEATSTQTVKFGDQDQSYTVVYNKDTPAFDMDTVTKTVHYVDQDGNKLADDFVTKANFTEIIDPVTSEKSYGPESGTLGYQANPTIQGYHVVTSPSEATAIQTVKFGDQDQSYTVVYNKDTPAFDMDTVTKTVRYVDQDGNAIAKDYKTQANFTEIIDPVAGEKSYGPESAVLGYQGNPTIQGYHVVTSPSEATATQTVKFGDQDQSYTVVYNKNTPAFDMDTVTKTVHYVDQDGNKLADDFVTKASFTETIDSVTGEKSYGPQSSTLGYQDNPVIEGYHVVTSPSEVTSTQIVKFGDVDVSYTVVYNKNTPIFDMDTVTKTVHYVDQDGNKLTNDFVTKANFTEIIDPVTGEKSYGPESTVLGYQANPAIEGYHVVASPAEAITTQFVTFGDVDREYNVVYVKDAGGDTDDNRPGKPSGNTDNNTPGKPSGNADDNTPTTPRVTLPNTSVGENPPAAGNAVKITTTSKNQTQPAPATTNRTRLLETGGQTNGRRNLPDTGDQNGSWLAIIGASLLGLIGMAGIRRKHHE